jgi:hypothetical protein
MFMFRRNVLVTIAAFVTLAASSPSAWAQRKEGITVRGHWSIDVKNPDGTLVSHSEFDNALNEHGKATLANLLGNTTTLQYGWGVRLMSGTSGQLISCPVTSRVVGATLELTGMTPENDRFWSDGSIGKVYTTTCRTSRCDLIGGFSEADVVPPIPYKSNQIVEVKVVISFAAAPHAPTPQ